jgi:hypothetical protein
MYDFNEAHSAQHTIQNVKYVKEEQAQKGAKMQIPYDEAPFEATLLPGQQTRLYGGIEIQNDTQEAIEVLIRFDLREGFFLTLDGLQTPIHIEAPVTMHSTYAIKVIAETWQLVPSNTLIS